MSAYQAVVTTGIYCRPGCSASPLDEHVRRYEFAAAAEANGFRPCLRCRPERQPGPAAWIGPSELVCRALRLIADGALDGRDAGSGESDLAARLGVSARHLRRLFAEHVGATPDTVARSRRAHLARRLLDETDLRVADVAFAAGFTSIRQMNRVVRETFRFTPTELRARRRRGDRLVADGGLDLRLPFRPPLPWDALLGFVRARAVPGVESCEASVYRRTILHEGHPGVVELHPDGDDHVRLRVHLPSWTGISHVVAGARRILDLDADPESIAAVLGHDELLQPRLAAVPGVRVPGAWDGFEVAVRAVLGQQVSVAGATTLAGRLVERFGDPVGGLEPFGLRAVFPAAERLAAVTPRELAAIGLPEARAVTIRSLARAVLDGRLRLEPGRGLERSVADLVALPGIGPWTAHYVAMRAIGEPDAFPAGDLGLRRALASPGTVRNGRSDERAVRERAEAWRPWRAYAAMLLWLA